jgi:hypothetical protein
MLPLRVIDCRDLLRPWVEWGRRAMRMIGAGMASSLGCQVAALVLALSSAAIGQDMANVSAITITPNMIAFIPPIARAVLSRDPERIAKAILEYNVNDQVRAKDGARAGFTPLIIAAALSEQNAAQMLIKSGAKITILDDFHRSALWYAALSENVEMTQTLMQGPGTSDVINAADIDFKRTPLHIALRGDAPQLVALLVKAGASLDQRDLLGNTPGDYCKQKFTQACKGLTDNK